MKLRSILLGFLGAEAALIGGFLAATCAHAQTYTNLAIKDGNGALQTTCALGVSTILTPCHLNFGLNGTAPIAQAMDGGGRAWVNVFNLPEDVNGILKSGVWDSVHNQAVDMTSGTSGSPAGGVISVQGQSGMMPFDVSVYPSSQTPITASSGNVANANAVATLGGVSAKTTYIDGFRCNWAGATAASVVTLTVSGVITGTMSFTAVFPAGATTAGMPVFADFSKPIPASAQNTPIVVTLPAGGTGATNATCAAWGFQQ